MFSHDEIGVVFSDLLRQEGSFTSTGTTINCSLAWFRDPGSLLGKYSGDVVLSLVTRVVDFWHGIGGWIADMCFDDRFYDLFSD